MRSERTFNAAIRRDPSYSLARTKLIKARLRSLQCNYRGEADRLFSADVSAKNSKLSSTGTDLITYNTAVGLVKLPRMPREKSVAGKILLNELASRTGRRGRSKITPVSAAWGEEARSRLEFTRPRGGGKKKASDGFIPLARSRESSDRKVAVRSNGGRVTGTAASRMQDVTRYSALHRYTDTRIKVRRLRTERNPRLAALTLVINALRVTESARLPFPSKRRCTRVIYVGRVER